MRSRQLVLAFLTLTLMTGALITLDRRNTIPAPAMQFVLENVRDHRPAQVPGGPEYAVDGGRLLVGRPGHWVEIPAPPQVIVAAVDIVPLADANGDPRGEILYIGAANELAVYASRDRGQSWTRGSLTHPRVHAHVVGGVTALALDPTQQLLYVGTDTAGLFRMRILPTGMVSTAQLLLSEPVRQVVADRLGRGLVVARTDSALYRGQDHGLRWVEVTGLPTAPTALALLPGATPYVVVGAADGSLHRSADAMDWSTLTHALPANLRVDALAADPLRAQALYAAWSDGDTAESVRLLYSEDGGETWLHFYRGIDARVVELLPVSGRRAAVYALTTTSRTPQALGNAPVVTARPHVGVADQAKPSATRVVAWIAAALGALALAIALVNDLVERRRPFPDPTADYAPVRLPTDRRNRL